MHLALEKGNIEMVRRLLQVDSELVRVKGNKCITPLHYAAKRGAPRSIGQISKDLS